jgi:hypothetical protein
MRPVSPIRLVQNNAGRPRHLMLVRLDAARVSAEVERKRIHLHAGNGLDAPTELLTLRMESTRRDVRCRVSVVVMQSRDRFSVLFEWMAS